MKDTASVTWLDELTLDENVKFSRKRYDFMESEFAKCVEYVPIDQDHFRVYSYRFADVILGIGPEILRVLELILFNRRRTRQLEDQPALAGELLKLQEKKDKRQDKLKDYLDVYSGMFVFPATKVRALDQYIFPFKSVSWWDNGYNALRHRVIAEFKKSATMKNSLFSLAGLRVLHAQLNRDHGWTDMGLQFFSEDTWSTSISRNEILEY